MITYKLSEESFESDDGDSYISFGVIAESDKGKIIASVLDLSTERSEVERLISLCNELELDPIHLNDVAEDFVVF